MVPTAQRVFELYELLEEPKQALVAELIGQLLPDDVATPEDLADIAEARAAYARGECTTFDDI